MSDLRKTHMRHKWQVLLVCGGIVLGWAMASYLLQAVFPDLMVVTHREEHP